MTLSFYVRDYLYIPLGGNRKGTVRTYVNLMISMLLCGLWHGAAWNFVIWGGYHGALLVGHQIFSRIRNMGEKFHVLPHTHLGTLMKILVTQYFIFFGWLIFRAESLSDVIYCAHKFVLIHFTIAHITPNIKIGLIIMSIILLLAIAVSLKKGVADWIARLITMNWLLRITSLKLQYWLCYLVIAILLLLCLSPSSSPEFIYFKF